MTAISGVLHTVGPWLRGIGIWLTVLFVATATQTTPAQPAGDGLTTGSLSYQGMERTYFFHLPARATASARPALLFALHGGGRAAGDRYADRTGYNSIADREGFIVVYPNGVDAQWNDGRGVTFRGAPDNGTVDDVGFISALIDLFVVRYNADPARIYVEGSSNGGMMSQRIACALSHRVAAVASVISSIPTNIYPSCASAGPVPVLIMNATTDPWVPWEGGTVAPFGRPSGEIVATWDAIRFWAAHDRCVGQPTTDVLPDTDRRDGSTVRRHVYDGCRDGGQVVLYEVIGAGHSRPGSSGRVPERILGPKNRDINASEEVWRFLSQFRR